MTEPEFPATSLATGSDRAVAPETLRDQLQTLRALLVAALMALLLLGAAVNIYLVRQFWMVRKDLAATQSFLQDYQKNKEPMLNEFVTRLQGFAQDHPDLTPFSKSTASNRPPPGRRHRRPLRRRRPARRGNSGTAGAGAKPESRSRRQLRSALGAIIGRGRRIHSAGGAEQVGLLVSPMDDQVANVGNPGEGVSENEYGILLVEQGIAEQ